MAVITLKQLLHRTSPGAAIGPSNPLEVRPYGGDGNPISPATELTLGGIKTEIEKLSGTVADGAQKVTLQGRKAVPKTKTVSVSTTLNAGNAENIDVVADAGKIWTIMAMYIQVPAVQGASSGTHRVQVLTTAGASAFPALLSFQNAYNGALSYQYMTIRTSDGNNDLPDDIAAQGQAIRGFVISPTLGLRINYMNSTNGNQTGARVVHLVVLEEDLVA